MYEPTLLYLTRDDIRSLELPPSWIVACIRNTLRAKGLGELESPPKHELEFEDGGTLRAMMASIPYSLTTGLKWIGGFPENRRSGLPAISALIILNDVQTGLPVAIMDGTWVTEVRTAAATAVAAGRLARPDSASLGIVACGAQGRSNARALCDLFPIEEVHAYDIDPERALQFADDMSRELGVSVRACPLIRDAVSDVDLLVTSRPISKQPAPSVQVSWLKPGAFVCMLDLDATVSASTVQEADLVVTDDIAQLEYFKSEGYIRDLEIPRHELGQLIAHEGVGRRTEDDVIVSIQLGIGALDVALAHEIYGFALDTGIGVRLPLWSSGDYGNSEDLGQAAC